MFKPDGYTDVSIGAGLNPGGHKCVIKRVQEGKSNSGKEKLIIYFDTDSTDSQPNYYGNKFLKNQSENSKYQSKPTGEWHMSTAGNYGTVNLKKLHLAISKSNPEDVLIAKGWTKVKDDNDEQGYSFEPRWGNADVFEPCYKDLKVGIVFRIEEYTTDLHELRSAVKAYYFCDYKTAADQPIPKRKEAPAPEPSLYDRYKEAQAAQPQQMSWDQPPIVQTAQSDGFMVVPDGLEDTGLPFM